MNEREIKDKMSEIVELTMKVYTPEEMSESNVAFVKDAGAFEFLMETLFYIVHDLADENCPRLGNDETLAMVVEHVVENHPVSLWGRYEELASTVIQLVSECSVDGVDEGLSVYEFYPDLYDC